jgi:hypothetical protein
MGLRGFGPWLRSRFPEAFRGLMCPEQPYDRVYIDVNTILYTGARLNRTGDQVLHSLTSSLHHIAAYRCRPSKKLFLAVDGAASLPKVALQRERRRYNGEKAERDGGFDCRQFTPGCLFMGKVTDRLISFGKALFFSSILDPSTELVIDPGTCAGEGEFKILQDINLANFSPGCRIAILSTDSDLFLYPLLLSNELDIDIHIPFLDEDSLVSVLSIRKLRNLLRQDIGHSNYADFIVLALLTGNDYLPAVPWGTLKTIYDTYIQFIKQFPSKYTPFFNATRSKFNENGLKSFLKYHRDHWLPLNYKSHECKALDVSNYFRILLWILQNMRQKSEHNNKLADLELAQHISFDSIINTELSNIKIDDNRVPIGYIPGAIGLSLLSPEGTGRSFLPKALRDLEASDRHIWWQSSSPRDLLAHYNMHVSNLSSILSPFERSIVFPGNQIVLKNGEISENGSP